MALSARRLAMIPLAGTVVALLTAPTPAASATTPRVISIRVGDFSERARIISTKLTPEAAAAAEPLEIAKRPNKQKVKGPTGPAGFVPPTAVGGLRTSASPLPEAQGLAALDDGVNLPINVGKIFIYKEASDQWVYCSGSVITSQFKNLVATAGHCIIDPATGEVYKYWAFVPSYNDNLLKWPYGNWIPYVATVFEDWAVFEDPDYDYGFVNVSRPDGETGEPSGARVGDFVGGNGFAWNQGINKAGYVFGYPHLAHLDGDKPFSGWTMKWCFGTIGQLAPDNGADFHVGWGRPINNQICSFTPGADGSPFLWQYSSDGDPLLRVGYLNSVISRVRDTDGNNRYDTWSGPYFDDNAKYLYDLSANRWSP